MGQEVMTTKLTDTYENWGWDQARLFQAVAPADGATNWMWAGQLQHPPPHTKDETC